MWTLSDYLALGLISGFFIHGFKACVACGPKIESRIAVYGDKLNQDKMAKRKKIIFGGGRQRTRCTHLYCKNKDFNGC